MGDEQELDADFVIDASGFDPLWFSDILSPSLSKIIKWRDKPALDDVKNRLNADLSVSYSSAGGMTFPDGLFLP